MMILTSIYGVVDGLFVSNFVGKTAFAAVNSCDPLHIGFGCLRLYAGDRRHCPCGENLGRGQAGGGKSIFSMLIYFAIGLGLVLTMLGIAALKKSS